MAIQEVKAAYDLAKEVWRDTRTLSSFGSKNVTVHLKRRAIAEQFRKLGPVREYKLVMHEPAEEHIEFSKRFIFGNTLIGSLSIKLQRPLLPDLDENADHWNSVGDLVANRLYKGAARELFYEGKVGMKDVVNCWERARLRQRTDPVPLVQLDRHSFCASLKAFAEARAEHWVAEHQGLEGRIRGVELAVEDLYDAILRGGQDLRNFEKITDMLRGLKAFTAAGLSNINVEEVTMYQVGAIALAVTEDVFGMITKVINSNPSGKRLFEWTGITRVVALIKFLVMHGANTPNLMCLAGLACMEAGSWQKHFSQQQVKKIDNSLAGLLAEETVAYRKALAWAGRPRRGKRRILQTNDAWLIVDVDSKTIWLSSTSLVLKRVPQKTFVDEYFDRDLAGTIAIDMLTILQTPDRPAEMEAAEDGYSEIFAEIPQSVAKLRVLAASCSAFNHRLLFYVSNEFGCFAKLTALKYRTQWREGMREIRQHATLPYCWQTPPESDGTWYFVTKEGKILRKGRRVVKAREEVAGISHVTLGKSTARTAAQETIKKADVVLGHKCPSHSCRHN